MFIIAAIFSIFQLGNIPTCFGLDSVQESHNDTELGSVIDVNDDVVIIDNEVYVVKSSERSYFRDKQELVKAYSCLYSFENYDFGDRGYIQSLEFVDIDDIPYQLDVIYTGESERIDAIWKDVHYLTSECVDASHIEIAMDFDVVDTNHVEYYHRLDPVENQSPLVIQPVFQTVFEQVIVKEGSEILTVVPAVFETVTEQVLVEESDVCRLPHTEYEVEEYQALLKDWDFRIEVDAPVEFETVAEQVLTKDAFTIFDIIDATEIVDSFLHEYHDTILMPRKVRLGVCQGFEFEDCFEVAYDTVMPRDTLLYRIDYQCPDLYELSKSKCIRTIQSQAIYETRFYDRLSSPTIVTEEEIPAEYETLSYIRIKDKSDIPDSCLAYSYTERSFEILVEPSIIEVEHIDAQFATRSFENLVSDSELLDTSTAVVEYHENIYELESSEQIEKVTPIINPIYTSIALAEVEDSLLARGYISTNFYDNYFEFLCDSNLPLSSPTIKVFELLGIASEFITADSLLADFIPRFYQPIISNKVPETAEIVEHNVFENCELTTYTVSTFLQTPDFDETFFVLEGVNLKAKVRHSADFSKLYRIDIGEDEGMVIYDMDIYDCEEQYPLVLNLGDTVWLDVLQVYKDEAERKVIEFDMPLSSCNGVNENLQFVEGVGANAGYFYNIENGKVNSQTQCIIADESLVYQSAGANTCGFVISTDEDQMITTTLSPNPTNDVLTASDGSLIVSVRNMAGMMVESQVYASTVDISDLPQGVYFVSVIDEHLERVTTVKVVKM